MTNHQPAVDTCLNCDQPVSIIIFKGSHYCCSNCFKELTDGSYDQALVNQIYLDRQAKAEVKAKKAAKRRKKLAAEKAAAKAKVEAGKS